MLQHEFEDGLRAITSFNMRDLETAGVIEPGDTGAWVDFTRSPYRWILHANPARSEKMWELIESKMSTATTYDAAVSAMHDIAQLAEEFGWPRSERLWAWLKHQLEGVRGLKRKGIYVASKVRHAPTWKAVRAAGLPIISTWIYEAGEGETGDFTDLWRRCIREATSAEVIIAYRLPGETLKGAFLEIGAALACGVPVYAVGLPPKGSNCRPEDQFTFGAAEGIHHFPDLDAAIDAARNLVAVSA